MSNSPRIFVTGVSGYVGGHTVLRIVEKHPEWHLVVLVRSEDQKKVILGKWPQVGVVIGSLDDKELMIAEGSKADVVLQAASADHVSVAGSLIEGLSEKKPTPGHYIQVSGTGMIFDVSNGFGQPSEKIYHDIADVGELTSLPLEGHPHRDAEKAVLDAHGKFGVPTAILSPPLIHGAGLGPLKTRSMQIPFMTEAVLKRGKGFQILEAQNTWDATHIDDISSAFILLTEEALKAGGGRAQWGKQGYYFADGAEVKWSDIAAAVAASAAQKGLIKSAVVEKLSVADATALHPWAPLLWGSNSRARSDRLHQLGWKPNGPSIFDSIPVMVAEEARTLGTQSSTTTFGK